MSMFPGHLNVVLCEQRADAKLSSREFLKHWLVKGPIIASSHHSSPFHTQLPCHLDVSFHTHWQAQSATVYKDGNYH